MQFRRQFFEIAFSSHRRQTNFNRPVSRSETGFASLIPIPGSVSGCGV